MARKRNFALVTLLGAVVVLCACEVQQAAQDPNYIPSAVELTRIAVEMDAGPLKSTVQSEAVRRFVAAQEAQARANAAQAIANQAASEAQAHLAAVTAVARATSDSLNARATRQALDASLTRQAQNYHSEETRQAQEHYSELTRQAGYAMATAQSVQATATAQSVQGTRQAQQSTRQAVEFIGTQTAQAVAFEATRTAVAFTDNATKVSIQATVTRVAHVGKIERTVKPILAGGGILLLVALVGGLFYLGWKFAQVLEDRARVIRPRPDEGEPIGVPGAGEYVLPYRLPNPVLTLAAGVADSPIVAPSVGAQMAVTMGQLKTNFAQAHQVGQVARATNRVPNFVRVGGRTRFAHPGQPPPGDNGQPWADVTPNWPRQVPLVGLFNEKRPSLAHIVIGVAPRDGGGLDVVSSTLDAMMHTLVVGASGWGKSAWLRTLLWQLEKAQEDVQVIGLDVSGSEMNALSGWSKLRYPVARTSAEAVTLLQEVSAEVQRRRELFEIRPSASKLSEYNAQVSDPLAPWVVVCDEGASLLNDKSTGDPLRDALQTSRQYGVYCVLATVTANATVIPTTLRDQFSTRLAFRTNSGRAVVEDNRPKDLVVKGRCWAQLSGAAIREIQGPWLNRLEFVRAMAGDGPRLALPDLVESAQGGNQHERIKEMAGNGASQNEIQRQVFGYVGGKAYETVKAVLSDTTTTGNGDTGASIAGG